MNIARFFRWMRRHGFKGVLLAGYTVLVVLAIAALRPQRCPSGPPGSLVKGFLSLPPLSDHLPTVGQFILRHWHNNSLLPRRINQTHYVILIDLLRRLDNVFRKWDIPYMMSAGTLLGSYFHHDMIPWDDDVDIVADFLRRKNIKTALESIGHPYKVHVGRDYFKLYRIDGIQIRKLPWRWPGLDIFLFASDGEEMWAYHKVHQPYPLSAVAPLTLRPFGPLWLPAPNNVMAVLAKLYNFNANDGSRTCVSNQWQHIVEADAKPYEVSCSRLMKSYPFVVSRQPAGDGLVMEILSIANRTLQQVAIPAASSKRL